MINAYRKWRSDLKLSPYKAATAEQQKCANESAKIVISIFQNQILAGKTSVKQNV